jgi:hypothetical protein
MAGARDTSADSSTNTPSKMTVPLPVVRWPNACQSSTIRTPGVSAGRKATY